MLWYRQSRLLITMEKTFTFILAARSNLVKLVELMLELCRGLQRVQRHQVEGKWRVRRIIQTSPCWTPPVCIEHVAENALGVRSSASSGESAEDAGVVVRFAAALALHVPGLALAPEGSA